MTAGYYMKSILFIINSTRHVASLSLSLSLRDTHTHTHARAHAPIGGDCNMMLTTDLIL
jgi:hypothetical protein